jgi:16S rRNA (guanine527-N7)-methyltransferase
VSGDRADPGPDQLPVELDRRPRRQLQAVLELIRAERSSVSSVTEPERGWRVHVADSLTGLGFEQLAEAERIADVGSGSGFPGLALAAALPGARVDLIESVGRKCDFMRRAIDAAGLENARVVNARSESWATTGPPEGGREAYDAVTARAVGRLSTLAELASPLLADSGVLVAWKGRRDAAEEAELEAAAERLAMRPEEVREVGTLAGSRHRHLYLIRKVAPTPKDLPRRPGIAKKRPYGRSRGAD